MIQNYLFELSNNNYLVSIRVVQIILACSVSCNVYGYGAYCNVMCIINNRWLIRKFAVNCFFKIIICDLPNRCIAIYTSLYLSHFVRQ